MKRSCAFGSASGWTGRAFLDAAPGLDKWEPLLPLVDVGIVSIGEPDYP